MTVYIQAFAMVACLLFGYSLGTRQIYNNIEHYYAKWKAEQDEF